VIARKVFEQDSMFYQAMQIGFLESVGLDWRLKDQYLDAVKAVTAEEVRGVATKYLIDDRLTIAVLEPLPAPAAGRN
ncbi:MAG: insulinase family protein, partial [Pseudomonadota bacterium]|nr:insulinase family protein [Pseudomonadota bacterium]